MTPELKARIEKFRRDGKNLFSTSEAIVIGLTHPDLYQRIMPERYQAEPMAAYFQELDGDQRMMVMGEVGVRTVKATWGMRVLFKLAGVKLQEVDGRFLVPDFRDVERRVGLACRRYNIRFAG